MFGDVSSLNSINEIYHSEAQLTHARETSKLAKQIYFSTVEDELTALENFAETIFFPDQFNNKQHTPCSENAYFLFMDKLNEEVHLGRTNKNSRIYICPTINQYGKSKRYGEIEIIHQIQTYLDDVYWTRHSFVMPNKNILEIRRISNAVMDMYWEQDKE